MAYAYSQIDDLMGQSSGQQNQNVFGAAGGDQNQPGLQTQVGVTPGVKTSTEGDLDSSGGGSLSGGSSAPKVSTDQQNRSSQINAVKANTGKTQTPAAIAGVQKSIDDANSGLAQRAADYSSQQKAKQNYGLDTSIIDQAIGNNADARSKTSQLLGRTDINQVDQFDPGNVSVKDADLLKSDAGLKELVARGQGNQYSPGMAAFDTMLLRRDPGFNAQVQGLQSKAADLSNRAAQQPEALQKEVSDYGKENLTASQKQAKDYLASQKQAVDSQNAIEAAAENQKLANLNKDQIKADAVAAAKQRAQEQLKAQYGDRANAQLEGVQVKPDDYVSFAQNYDPSQFYSQDDANKYNSINALLGIGGPAQSASAALANPYSVKSDDLYNTLYSGASQARQAQDTTDLQKISDILGGANKTAETQNKTRAEDAKNYKDYLNLLGQNYASEGGLGKYYTQPNIEGFLGQYVANNPLAANPLAGTDLLSQEQASQLNSLNKDLGRQDTYNAGAYAGKDMSSPLASVNGDAYKTALLSYLQGFVPPPAAPPAPPPAPDYGPEVKGTIDPNAGQGDPMVSSGEAPRGTNQSAAVTAASQNIGKFLKDPASVASKAFKRGRF